ncbi:MAG: hypothetical protein ACRDV4_10930 [Acidimicrobiales bacterium]
MCTGNIFRSVMAEAYLAKVALDRDLDLTVESAGTLDGERPVSPAALEIIGRDGIDMSNHLSSTLSDEAVRRADLVLAMAREHLREVVLIDPEAWPRTFTLKEIVRRAEARGPRRHGVPFPNWLASLGQDRTREDLLGWSDSDDVADPVGGGPDVIRATGEEIHELVSRLVDLLALEKRAAP